MNYDEKETVKEVRDALRIHYTILANNLALKARIDKGTLKDIVDGMEISLEKLNDVLDDVEMLYRNYYKCPNDGEEWEDEWDSMCNDHCPKCEAEIEPYKSEEIANEK